MLKLIADFEVFAATVFYKILSGRQPSQLVQIHRRFGHWFRLHPQGALSIWNVVVFELIAYLSTGEYFMNYFISV